MKHLNLSDAGCCLLGLVPWGPVEPGVLGLVPIQRRDRGWLFRVETPWRLAVVAEVVRSLAVRPGAAQVRRTLLGRLGG